MLTVISDRLHNLPRWQYALLLVALVAGVLRFYGLETWPVFIDEDLHTWRSFEMGQLPLQKAIIYPVVKPPLAFFLQDVIARLAFDHLIAGRVLSAIAGTLTTVLTFYLGRRLGRVSIGLIAASIYAVSPITVMHERMVLQDGPMAVLALSAVLVSWRAIERESWSLASLAALLGAIAVQLKVPSVAISVVPIMLFFTFRGPWLSRKAAMAIVGCLGPVLSYLALRLGPLGPGLAI